MLFLSHHIADDTFLQPGIPLSAEYRIAGRSLERTLSADLLNRGADARPRIAVGVDKRAHLRHIDQMIRVI